MNTLHLRYAVEIEKTNSLSKAAGNLYIAQPNLSRAIKELEDSLGIIIFSRTPKGMFVTPTGAEFLQRAKQVLRTIDDFENIYTKGKKCRQTFSISTPATGYLSQVFTQFVKRVGEDKLFDFLYRETNTTCAINNILYMDYKLGIIRCEQKYEQYFNELLDDRGLWHEVLLIYTSLLVMSKDHPLANRDIINIEDLALYTEIIQDDPSVSLLSDLASRTEECLTSCQKRITVCERASQLDLLCMVPHTFMWAPPQPDAILARYNLVQKPCANSLRLYEDMFIHKIDYRLSELDQIFMDELQKVMALVEALYRPDVHLAQTKRPK